MISIGQAVLVNMAMYGRVAVCGAITGLILMMLMMTMITMTAMVMTTMVMEMKTTMLAGYNDTSPTLLPALQPLFVSFQVPCIRTDYILID